MKKRSPKLKTILSVLLLLCLWQGAAMLLNKKVLLASPAAVFLRLLTIWKETGFMKVTFFSFVRIAGGFLAAFLIGSALAVAAGKFPSVEILLSPLMAAVKSVPVASFIIIALIWLSSSRLSVFISFLMVLPIIYHNCLAGIKGIDKGMLEMADVFRFTFWKRFVFIWLPAMKPHLFSACRTALGIAWKSGIAAEIIGIPSGSIGEKLYEAKAYLNTTDLFAWTVIIVLLSFVFEKLCLKLLEYIYNRIENI